MRGYRGGIGGLGLRVSDFRVLGLGFKVQGYWGGCKGHRRAPQLRVRMEKTMFRAFAGVFGCADQVQVAPKP